MAVKVLVIEDQVQGEIESALKMQRPEKPIQNSLWKRLDDRGTPLPLAKDINVVIATNKEDALTRLQEAIESPAKCPDLVILDLGIPDNPDESDSIKAENGFEVLRFIRMKLRRYVPFDVPVLILSQVVQTEGGHEAEGYREFLRLVEQPPFLHPDDILLKRSLRGSDGGHLGWEALISKIAHFMVDLDERDLDVLDNANIYYGPRTPEEITDKDGKPHIITKEGFCSYRILRQLKRYARSTPVDVPLPDVLLLGKNGVGKTTFARAFHLLRRQPDVNWRLGFHHEDLGSLDPAGSAPSLRLFGASSWPAGGQPLWNLGTFTEATYYNTTNKNHFLEGQVEEKWLTSMVVPPDPPKLSPSKSTVQPGSLDQHYPTPDDEPDFELSGTVFLDEVVNIDPSIRGMLLQTLSYDRKRRFVRTTGLVSRKIKIGPAIVMATRKNIQELLDEEEESWQATRDYVFRIDQIRVNIPELKDRRNEIIPLLKNAVRKRRPGSMKDAPLDIDGRIHDLLTEKLNFENNLADLERIADQVLPEETSITFRHLKPLLERSPITVHRPDIAMLTEEAEEYLRQLKAGGEVKLNLTEVADDLGVMRAYYVVLVFLEKYSISGVGAWPELDEIKQYLDYDKLDSFRAAVRRLRARAHKQDKMDFDIKKDLLEDLADWNRLTARIAADRAARLTRGSAEDYLHRLQLEQSKANLSNFAEKVGLKQAYQVVLVFLDNLRGQGLGPWPTVEQLEQYFDYRNIENFKSDVRELRARTKEVPEVGFEISQDLQEDLVHWELVAPTGVHRSTE